MPRELTSQTPWLEGVGLHSGSPARLRLTPAPREQGIVFSRCDLQPPMQILVCLACAQPRARQTVLQGGQGTIRTVEHLLSALLGLEIVAAKVQLWGPELPALDGSALPFARALLQASRPCSQASRRWRVVGSYARGDGMGGRCALSAGEGLTVECRICFAELSPSVQWARLQLPDLWTYFQRIAPARTFGLLSEADSLRQAGRARGASLKNVLVFDRQQLINPSGSRFFDEPVRHKLLDALGDIGLLGGPLQGRVRLQRCSHRLLVATLRGALEQGALVQGD